MQENNFHLRFRFDQSPMEVYNAINDVQGWWSQDFTGASNNTGDEFAVRFADMHYSKHRLTEMLPGRKINWLVTDSRLSFLRDKTEWNGTQNLFEISEGDGKTILDFHHIGLQPSLECFGSCSKGWTHYLQNSLVGFIKEGKGKPNLITTK